MTATTFLARLHATERLGQMERGGYDYTGTSPCIPPLALARLVEWVLLRARVARDEEAA